MTRNIVAIFVAFLAVVVGVGLYLRNNSKCVAGVCTADGKCGCNTGEVCVNGGCVDNSKCVAGVCTADGKCGCNTGEVCVNGGCVDNSKCVAGVCTADGKCGCNTGEVCVNGGCVINAYINATICGGDPSMASPWQDKFTKEVYGMYPLIDCTSSKEQHATLFNYKGAVIGTISAHKPNGFTFHYSPDDLTNGYYTAVSAANGSITWSVSKVPVPGFDNYNVPDTIVLQRLNHF